MDKKEPTERREHKRFQVQSGAFAFPRAYARKLWQIIDISRGGLAFRYVAPEEMPQEPPVLDILTRDTRFTLRKIPFKIISDSEIADDPASSHFTLRRRSVQFGQLTNQQILQLEYFIVNHTIGEA